MFYTYSDSVELLVDYLGGGISDVVVRDCKRAIHDAYRDLANAHTWTHLYRLGRVNTNSTITDGQLTYQASGGAHPRLVTITGDVWPAWANMGFIRVDVVNYRVDRRISDTQVTLDEELCPDADITTPTKFVMYQDTYLLPADYIAQDQALYERNFGGMTYTHPREWAYENRYKFAQGIPVCYTIIPARQYPGRICMAVFPFPVETRTIDFIYKRSPRPLVNYRVTTGTLAATAASVSVVGTGTAFDQSMAGSVLRISANALPPTSHEGSNPPAFETTVAEIDGPTTLVAVDPIPSTYAAAAYVISDPVDLELHSMLNAFKRGCEKQISMNRTLKDKPSAANQYRVALESAKSADSRSFAGRHEGQQLALRQRLRDMPVGPDEP